MKLIRKFKIKGLPKDSEFEAMPFGRQIEHLQAIRVFKNVAFSTWLSQKRKSWQSVIKEAIRVLQAKEYYCEFHCDPDYKDDSFQFFYR